MVLTYLLFTCFIGALLGCCSLNRHEDVEGIVSLQSNGFYEPWEIEWLDTFFLKLFAVS